MTSLLLKPFFSFSPALGVVALGSASAILAAFILEYGGWMEPCALCWTQRFIMFTVFSSAVILWLLKTRSIRAQRLAIGIISICSLLGIAAAIRHMYVIINPNVVSCGPNITNLIEFFPWQDIMMVFISGQSACTEVSKLLGVPMPIWSLISFFTFSALPLFAHLHEKKTP